MDRKFKDYLEKITKYFRQPFILNEVTERELEKTRGEGFYHKFDIDLSSANSDKEFPYSGDRILTSRIDSKAEIKLNSRKNELIDLKEIGKIKAPFKRFYLTNPAGSSGQKLTLYAGNKGMFEPDLIFEPKPLKKPIVSADATGGVAVWTPTTGTKFVVTDIILSTDTAMKIELKDGATAEITVYLGINGGFVTNLKKPWKSTAINNVLTIVGSVAGNIGITVFGYEE